MTDLMEIREVRELVTDIRQELQDRRQDRKELIQILYEIESCLMKLAEKERGLMFCVKTSKAENGN